MIVLLSPAKTLDFNPTDLEKHSTPRMLDKSEKLINALKKKSKKKIMDLMSVSDKIAELNVERYKSFETPFNLGNAKQAALAFKGDVYLGLEAGSFEGGDFDFAQDHLRILSGLYGLLKPLDLMQPYRLEMGTKLKVGRKDNLYQFWNEEITKLINIDLKESGRKEIINLASKEYFSSVKPKLLKGDLYQIDFKENRNGVLKVISFNAKKARGRMANLIVKNRITTAEELKYLEVNEYLFNEGLSSENHFIFTK